MKKIIALLLALVMVLGLAACGETAAPETTPAATEGTEGTAEATEGEIRFRKWDPETGILSGNFEFICDAPQFDGSVKHLSITEGNFDVRFND